MRPEVVACLACPYCGSALSEAGPALRCAEGHSFDIARQGYVTLLPRGFRAGAHARDSAAMVAARADFLSAGHYTPLTAALTAAATTAPPGPVLDLGAGTAHHLAATLNSPTATSPAAVPGTPAPAAAGVSGAGSVVGTPAPAAAGVAGAGSAVAGSDEAAGVPGAGSAVAESDEAGAVPGAGSAVAGSDEADGGADGSRVGIALDLSRYAARRAARVDARVGAVVADVWSGVPVRDGAVSLVLGVFAPRNGAETARVLRPGGLLVVATPAAGHLGELVDALGLLSVDTEKDARLAAALEPHLTPADRVPLTWTLRLSRADAVAAVAMGPSARHLTPDDLARRAAALPDPVEVTAAVDLRTYRPA